MTDINQLVQLNVELEGLLKVLLDRKSIHAKSLLAEKFEQYSTLIRRFLAEEEGGESVPEAVVESVADEASDVLAEGHQVEVKDQEAEDSEVEDQDDLAAEAIERGENELSHMVDREPNPNVLKAFSLNDKFLYTRELFHGDDRDYSDTLTLISEMDSYEEAEEYLVHDLMWDPENTNVKSFLAVLAKAFK